MGSGKLTKVLFVYIIVFITLTVTSSLKDVSLDDIKPIPQLRWHFTDSLSKIDINNKNKRFKRSSYMENSPIEKLIDEPACSEDIRRLCGLTNDKNQDHDDLVILECVQTFKTNEVASINEICQHKIWTHIVKLTNDQTVESLTSKMCGNALHQLGCKISPESKSGTYLGCIIDKREDIQNPQCLEYIRRLEFVAFGDFRVVTHFDNDCEDDIQKFECGRIQPYKDISQGLILACLQQHIEKLGPQCKKRILHVSEIQADNIKLDRQLYMACTSDHIKFCSDIRPGSGQVYKCLIQHKMDKLMTKQCQDHLTRREKLIAFDYKVSKGLVRACKEDIKTYHCRRSVSEDKDIRLAQILLCLESVAKNMSKIDRECQAEMFDHRKILMEDYRLSPEIVNDCGHDIFTFCNRLEVGGKTIHCLMEHTRAKKKKLRVSPECQRALEGLVKEADAGEDWRLDPVLHDACQPVVDSVCRDVRAGDARVISCLMEKLGTDKMTEPCETALVQIQYFVARDFKLDPQLYRACNADASRLCHAKKVWASDGSQMDPERGPLVLPCLYRYAYHPQPNMTLKPVCLEEIRRVMRQRAVNVDLQPEIEEACLNDLALYCFDKTNKGEEIFCLQDNLENLEQKCKLAVGNLTEEQAEHVELNPIITSACESLMEKHCEAELKAGKDEGDLMECLIEHKNDPDVRADYKCRAVVEHFQLISLKDYHFTYKFKEACRPHVTRRCPNSKTKAEVIQCLSEMVQQDIIKETSHRIPKECRQQLRAQLYQRRENINFDPVLQKACAADIKKLCFKIEPGHAQIIECLASHKPSLSEDCHRKLFNVRQQDLQDSSSDFTLLNTCHTMVQQFCYKEDQSRALECLKRWKDKPTFDEKCKNIVIKRMIEQNTDYRFNPALQAACSFDINKHCKNVLKNEPLDKELEGKVIKCLKGKFRESVQLADKCQQEMINILKEAALNYHLNPILATLCAEEIDKICGDTEKTPGFVEECLKTEFHNKNPDMQERCKMEVAFLIEQSKADINVDPLLQNACAIDVSKYCSNVPHGAGRHIMCLQNVLVDKTKALQPDCYKMLSTRIEMFSNAIALTAPNSMGELYLTVNRSPARRYFMIVALTMIGLVFITGLFCGKIARRTLTMKNK